jgi:cell division protein FtsL
MMVNKKKFLLAGVIICVVSLITQSCNQRYFFRKKVNVEKDSAEVEKQFQIAW